MYFDGDAVPIIRPQETLSLKERIISYIFGQRLDPLSLKQLLCTYLFEYKYLGIRFALRERQFPDEASIADMWKCTNVLSNTEWEAVDRCHRALGNVAARSDSVRALSVHYVDSMRGFLAPWVQDLVQYVPSTKVIELHMTKKERSCSCRCLNRNSTQDACD